MAKSYRLIAGDVNTVNQQLNVLSVSNQQGAPHAKQTPILMSSVIAQGQGNMPPHVTLYVIVEVDQP